jgi:hypothetical protein
MQVRGYVQSVERMKAGAKCGALYVQTKDTKAQLLEVLDSIVTQMLDVFQV